jgi:hypothetical protein
MNSVMPLALVKPRHVREAFWRRGECGISERERRFFRRWFFAFRDEILWAAHAASA